MNKSVMTIIMAAWALGFAGNIPTDPQRQAFLALAQGTAQWPVWQVKDNTIAIDGKLTEAEWAVAHPIYMTGEWMWSAFSHLSGGTKDVLTCWRVLYDTANVYLACEFYDDIHSEGDGREPWPYNDGLDITFFRHGGVITYPPMAPSFIRIIRRFTEKEGLYGFTGNGWVPNNPLVYPGWTAPEPEGSDKLGGIETRASAMEGRCGSWAMEIRVPLRALFLNSGQMDALAGMKFKMNLAFTDDDTLPGNDPFRVMAGTQRYSTTWRVAMGDDSARAVFSPCFMLAGTKGDGGSFQFLLPDEPGLYCGTTPEMYNHYIVQGVAGSGCVAVENGVRSSTDLETLTASPNPFHGAAQISYTLPGRAAFKVFDMRGLMVRDLGLAGTGRVVWDGRNGSGRAVAPGAYILRMDAGKESKNLKLTVIK